MKRKTIFLLLAVALLSSAALASGVFQNAHGTISISDSGIVSRGSQLVVCNKLMARRGGALGSVSFVAGPLLTGSLQAGGTFSADGSSFAIVGQCKKDEPRGVVFIGTFEGPITWTLVSQAGEKLTFNLTGFIKGTNRKGNKVNGTTTQMIVTTRDQLDQNVGHIDAGFVMFGT